jgi:hypothetical protein
LRCCRRGRDRLLQPPLRQAFDGRLHTAVVVIMVAIRCVWVCGEQQQR